MHRDLLWGRRAINFPSEMIGGCVAISCMADPFLLCFLAKSAVANGDYRLAWQLLDLEDTSCE